MVETTNRVIHGESTESYISVDDESSGCLWERAYVYAFVSEFSQHLWEITNELPRSDGFHRCYLLHSPMLELRGG